MQPAEAGCCFLVVLYVQPRLLCFSLCKKDQVGTKLDENELGESFG